MSNINKRRSFTPEFKLQCVLEVISGQKTPAQICREHNIGESILVRWRQQFAKEAPKIFANSSYHKGNSDWKRIAELERLLERLVGRLTMELDTSKKLFSYLYLR